MQRDFLYTIKLINSNTDVYLRDLDKIKELSESGNIVTCKSYMNIVPVRVFEAVI